jgi:type II secretory pathway component HofQ
MPKKTLLEKLEQSSVPKAWVAEFRTLLRKMDKQERQINEQLDIIDALARLNEAMAEAKSMSQLRRLKIQMGLDND